MFVIDSALWSLYQAIASLCHSWSLMLGQTRSNLASEGWARDHLVCFWYVWSNQGKCSSSTRLLDWFYHVLSKSSGKWSGRRRGTVVPLDLKQRSQFRYNIYIYTVFIYIYIWYPLPKIYLSSCVCNTFPQRGYVALYRGALDLVFCRPSSSSGTNLQRNN